MFKMYVHMWTYTIKGKDFKHMNVGGYYYYIFRSYTIINAEYNIYVYGCQYHSDGANACIRC